MFQRIHPLCKIIDKIYLDKPYLLIKLLLCSSEKVSKMGNGLTFTEYSYKSHLRMSDVISVKKCKYFVNLASMYLFLLLAVKEVYQVYFCNSTWLCYVIWMYCTKYMLWFDKLCLSRMPIIHNRILNGHEKTFLFKKFLVLYNHPTCFKFYFAIKMSNYTCILVSFLKFIAQHLLPNSCEWDFTA